MPEFTRKLLQWNRSQNRREMPWKGEKDPYRIWLSEIILQQTRVEQGLGYYRRFITQYPDIHQLAAAPAEQVYKLWEGLGYYTRCKNLLHTAKRISAEMQGNFPRNYEDILQLKGVGPYTAAAISSFAYELPYAVLDGNVFRVLARYFGISEPVNSPAGRKIFESLATDLLDRKKPSVYNQAIMDFGATVCKPLSPGCTACTLRHGCHAFQKDLVHLLPVKEKKQLIRRRWFYFLVCEWNGRFAVRKRGSGDIWENLFEFPSLEAGEGLSARRLASAARKSGIQARHTAFRADGSFEQQLTHQKIHAHFFIVSLDQRESLKGDWTWIAGDKIHKLAFPRILREYIQHSRRISG